MNEAEYHAVMRFWARFGFFVCAGGFLIVASLLSYMIWRTAS